MSADAPAMETLAACLRGDQDALDVAGADPDRFLPTAEAHQVVGLLAARLLGPAPGSRSTGQRLATRTRQLATLDLVRERDLRGLLGAFAAERIPVLVMKGAQLAYTHYPRPDLRARIDTDLLIAPETRPRATAVLQGLGYAPIPHVGGDLVSYQTSFVLSQGDVTTHVVDLHWRIANPQPFGDVLEFAELHSRAVSIPTLSNDARGLSNADALLLACVHRIIHHADAPTLIWQYDIHLLASRCSAEATGETWATFVALARGRRVARLCEHSLRAAARTFGTAVPADVWTSLGDHAQVEGDRAAYLNPGRRHASRVLDDLRALPTWRDRLRLLGQHALPPARYMRETYAPASTAPLPLLYVRRVWRGARKWMGRS